MSKFRFFIIRIDKKLRIAKDYNLPPVDTQVTFTELPSLYGPSV